MSSSKRLIDVLDDFDNKDEVKEMVLNKLQKLIMLITPPDGDNYESESLEDLDFVGSLMDDLRETEHKVTRTELEHCNKLYRKYKK